MRLNHSVRLIHSLMGEGHSAAFRLRVVQIDCASRCGPDRFSSRLPTVSVSWTRRGGAAMDARPPTVAVDIPFPASGSAEIHRHWRGGTRDRIRYRQSTPEIEPHSGLLSPLCPSGSGVLAAVERLTRCHRLFRCEPPEGTRKRGLRFPATLLFRALRSEQIQSGRRQRILSAALLYARQFAASQDGKIDQ